VAGSFLSLRKAAAEFVNVVIGRGEKRLSGLPHFRHDRIVPKLWVRMFISHFPFLP
jgi:hypothetical protein